MRSCTPSVCFSPIPTKQLMFIARSKEVLSALSLQHIQTSFFWRTCKNARIHSACLLSSHNLKSSNTGKLSRAISQCPTYIYERCPARCRTRALCLICYYFSCCNHVGQITGRLTCGHGWAWTGSSTIQKPVATCMMLLSGLRLLLDWLKCNRSCSKCNSGMFCQCQYESPLAY